MLFVTSVIGYVMWRNSFILKFLIDQRVLSAMWPTVDTAVPSRSTRSDSRKLI